MATHAVTPADRSEKVDVQSKVLKCEEVKYIYVRHVIQKMTSACARMCKHIWTISEVLKCEEVLYMCMHMRYTYLHVTILLSLLLYSIN